MSTDADEATMHGNAKEHEGSGASIAIAYHQAADQASAVIADVTAAGARAAMFQADQALPEDVTRMVDEVAERFGRIDVLVNSAGVFLPGGIGALTPEQVSHQWAVNVHGVVATTQRALTHMPDGGRIINLGSVAGERAFAAGFGDYSATKSALMSYSRSWAHELAPRNITSNTVIVGFAQTDMVIPADSEMGKVLRGLLPFHRYADPDEVAALIAFLATPSASYVSGGELRVDGGWNA
jgi:3-oxoacyl-[acyl-carrier protein] reductase